MTEARANNHTNRQIWFIAPLVGLFFVLLCSLGTWQLQRMYWKNELLADIHMRQTLEPVSLSNVEALVASGVDIDYRRMIVRGTFLHTQEKFFFSTFNGATGYYVYTPMTLVDGRYLFINRGFIPYDMKELHKRNEGAITGLVEVVGLARAKLLSKPSYLVPDNHIASNVYYWKDLHAMADASGIPRREVLPFFMDADHTLVPGGWPKGGVTMLDLPNNHLQYAITWFGLALALVIVTVIAYFRSLKGKRQ